MRLWKRRFRASKGDGFFGGQPTSDSITQRTALGPEGPLPRAIAPFCQFLYGFPIVFLAALFVAILGDPSLYVAVDHHGLIFYRFPQSRCQDRRNQQESQLHTGCN